MTKRKCMAILVLALLAASSGKAQTCQVTITTSEVDVLSGSAVTASSLQIIGSGRGRQNIGGGLEAAIAFQTLAAGDFTELGSLPTLTGGTVPAAGMEAGYNGGGYSKFTLYVENVGGVLTAYFDKGRFLSPNYTWTHIGSQGISNLTNFGFKLVRSGNNLTGSITTDGTNYLALGTFAGTTAAAGGIGIFVDSGDITNLTAATFKSLTVNGAAPSLTYSAGGSLPGGSLQNGVVTQGGNLFIGKNTITGQITQNGFCGPQVNIENLILVKDSLGNVIGGLSNRADANIPNCPSVCQFSFSNPNIIGSGSYGPFALTHGQQYTFESGTSASFAFGQATNIKDTLLNP